MKINVIGTSGSGKSTVAKKIADKLNIPYIEMDRIFWGPNWHWPSDEVFLKNLKNELSTNTWVLDGNYTRSEHIKWKNVNLVVWVDLPFYITLYQAIARALKRAISQEELWPDTNNRESLKKSFFSKDSIIWWTIKTYKKNIKKYETKLQSDEYSHIRFVRLTSQKIVNEYILNLNIESIYNGNNQGNYS